MPVSFKTMTVERERRRIQRIRLPAPLRAMIGQHRAVVLDISIRGLRIAHQQPIGIPGDKLHLVFEWDGSRISVDCEVRWSAPQETKRGPGAPTLYHSGLDVKDTESAAARHLREIVTAYVVRALDEQKANARGIPAVAAMSYQTGKADAFIRHQYINGSWREIPTSDPRQPITGFTIDAEHNRDEVTLLRESYAKSDDAGRASIRKMAELSIESAEGVPTRRYHP